MIKPIIGLTAAVIVVAMCAPASAKPLAPAKPAAPGNPVISCDWISPGGHTVRPPGLCGGNKVDEEPTPPSVNIDVEEIYPVSDIEEDAFYPPIEPDAEFVNAVADAREEYFSPALDTASVPEPSTLALLLAGGISVAVRRWRTRNPV